MANDKNQTVVMMTKEFWLGSQLSVDYIHGVLGWNNEE